VYGTIRSTSGAYAPGFVEHDTSPPSTTVATGPAAAGKDSGLASELARLGATGTPYAPTGPNSNTVTKTLLDKNHLPVDKPVMMAPGFGDPDI